MTAEMDDLISLLTEYVASKQEPAPKRRRASPRAAVPAALPDDAGEYARRVAALTKPGEGRGLGYAPATLVAEGVYACVTGMLPTGEQASLTGYVLAAYEVVGNFEGWTTEDAVVVVVAESPEHLDGVPVQVPVDGQVAVIHADEALCCSSEGVSNWLRPTLDQALRHAGLKLGAKDGPGVVSRELAWTSRNPEERLAERMFSSRGGSPVGAYRSLLRQQIVDKAKADGVWPGPAEIGPVPLRLVREGAHGTITGTVDGREKTVTGEFVAWWSPSSGADRRPMVNVGMRMDGGPEVVRVTVPATGAVFHLGPATPEQPEQAAQVTHEQGDLLGDFLGNLERALAAQQPRVIPLADAEWGMYGRIDKNSGIYPAGEPQRKDEVGWITTVPRIYTGGEAGANHPKWRGKPLLSTFLSRTGNRGGTSVYAFPDATFTVLDPPEGEKLKVPKFLSRRLPIADLRRGDVFYIWTQATGGAGYETLPRYHVQDTPVAIDKKTSAVHVLVGGEGEPETLELPSWDRIDVEDPRKYEWKAAEPLTFTAVCPSCGARTESVPAEGDGDTWRSAEQWLFLAMQDHRSKCPGPAAASDGFDEVRQVRTPDTLAADVVARFAHLDRLPRIASHSGCDCCARVRVLEPSAGDGSLVGAVFSVVPHADLFAVEPDPDRAAKLRAMPQTFPVHECTLEEFAQRFGSGLLKGYDLIVMNPPYSAKGKRALWLDHVRLAWKLLAEGGRLVAILPRPAQWLDDPNVIAVLDLVGADAEREELPKRSFSQYGTDIDTWVLAASKRLVGVT